MASSYIAAKVGGAVLAIAFLGTLKPLFRQVARVLEPSMRDSFTAQVNDLSTKSGVGASAILALLIGIGVWVAVAIALDSVAGDLSTWWGAAAGFSVLYAYFFLIFYLRARRSLRATKRSNNTEGEAHANGV